MGFKTCGISQTTRFKRRTSSGRSGGRKVPSDSDKRNYSPSPSPTAAPFNSTSFLVRQKSQHREEALGASKSVVREQYGSNVTDHNMIASCSLAIDNHDRAGCGYRETAQRPTVVGMSNHDSRDISQLHLQLQGLQITDCPRETHQRHQPRSDSTSAVSMELEYSSAARDQGAQAFQHRPDHRRVQSFTDDNFDLLQTNASAFMYDLLEDSLLEGTDNRV